MSKVRKIEPIAKLPETAIKPNITRVAVYARVSTDMEEQAIDSNKLVTLYHKHTADTKYYHKHWETWTVAMAVESIKNHDTYVIENGKTVRWMKQKGRVNCGSI